MNFIRVASTYNKCYEQNVLVVSRSNSHTVQVVVRKTNSNVPVGSVCLIAIVVMDLAIAMTAAMNITVLVSINIH